MNKQLKEAYFAGGCFWCIEGVMNSIPWVVEAISWFAGGTEKNPGYMEVCRWETGHREAVKVVYDPDEVDYLYLVSTFWRQIDPTDNEGQFADRGDHYRTALFYIDEYQKQIAQASKDFIEQSNMFDEPVATDILEYTTFYPAEDYHQNYSQKESCHYTMYKKWSGRAWYIEQTWWEEDYSMIWEEDYKKIQEQFSI